MSFLNGEDGSSIELNNAKFNPPFYYDTIAKVGYVTDYNFIKKDKFATITGKNVRVEGLKKQKESIIEARNNATDPNVIDNYNKQLEKIDKDISFYSGDVSGRVLTNSVGETVDNEYRKRTTDEELKYKPWEVEVIGRGDTSILKNCCYAVLNINSSSSLGDQYKLDDIPAYIINANVYHSSIDPGSQHNGKDCVKYRNTFGRNAYIYYKVDKEEIKHTSGSYGWGGAYHNNESYYTYKPCKFYDLEPRKFFYRFVKDHDNLLHEKYKNRAFNVISTHEDLILDGRIRNYGIGYTLLGSNKHTPFKDKAGANIPEATVLAPPNSFRVCLQKNANWRKIDHTNTPETSKAIEQSYELTNPLGMDSEGFIIPPTDGCIHTVLYFFYNEWEKKHEKNTIVIEDDEEEKKKEIEEEDEDEKKIKNKKKKEKIEEEDNDEEEEEEEENNEEEENEPGSNKKPKKNKKTKKPRKPAKPPKKFEKKRRPIRKSKDPEEEEFPKKPKKPKKPKDPKEQEKRPFEEEEDDYTKYNKGDEDEACGGFGCKLNKDELPVEIENEIIDNRKKKEEFNPIPKPKKKPKKEEEEEEEIETPNNKKNKKYKPRKIKTPKYIKKPQKNEKNGGEDDNNGDQDPIDPSGENEKPRKPKYESDENNEKNPSSKYPIEGGKENPRNIKPEDEKEKEQKEPYTPKKPEQDGDPLEKQIENKKKKEKSDYEKTSKPSGGGKKPSFKPKKPKEKNKKKKEKEKPGKPKKTKPTKNKKPFSPSNNSPGGGGYEYRPKTQKEIEEERKEKEEKERREKEEKERREREEKERREKEEKERKKREEERKEKEEKERKEREEKAKKKREEEAKKREEERQKRIAEQEKRAAEEREKAKKRNEEYRDKLLDNNGGTPQKPPKYETLDVYIPIDNQDALSTLYTSYGTPLNKSGYRHLPYIYSFPFKNKTNYESACVYAYNSRGLTPRRICDIMGLSSRERYGADIGDWFVVDGASQGYIVIYGVQKGAVVEAAFLGSSNFSSSRTQFTVGNTTQGEISGSKFYVKERLGFKVRSLKIT